MTSHSLRFKDCIALVTGAASGIGFSIARQFWREGAFVTLVDRDTAWLERALDSLGNDRSSAITADVSDEGQVERMLHSTLQGAEQKIDILVNSAGVYTISPLTEITPVSWDEVLGVNLHGTFLVCQAVARPMIERGCGTIVNISSVAASVGNLSEPAAYYNASKAGVLGLTKQLAVELAPHGIRVNAVCPGVIDTPMLMLMKRDPAAGEHYLRESAPLGRLGTADEVASAVLFLASDEASYVTGTVISVDGGLLAR